LELRHRARRLGARRVVRRHGTPRGALSPLQGHRASTLG
jgi:hypothetical protein